MLFFGAYVISCALNPYVFKLIKKGLNRNLSVIIVVLSSVIIVFSLFVPIFFVAFKEIKTFILIFPEKLTQVENFLLETNIYGYNLLEVFNIQKLIDSSPALAQDVFNQSWNFTIGIFQVSVIFIILVMVIYYILVDKDYLKKKFLQFFPPDLKDNASIILANISNKVGAYVRAQIISMASVGIMTAIVLIILGVEYSTLLGLIAGILDIIPLLGPSIALGVILLIAYPLGIVKIILVILGFLLVQQLSNYVVRPILFGKLMSLHPLMIFLALFLSDQFLGFWGVILSPAIASCFCVLVDELYIKQVENE